MVNAERVINGSSPEQSQELFDTMVHFLSRKRLLTRILLDGVIHNHMILILEKVVNGRIKTIDIPWRGQPTPSAVISRSPTLAAFSGDGNFIATASRDGMVKIWTGTPGRERISNDFPGLPAYSPDGSQWAMAPWWKGACVYGADNGRVAAAFPYLQVSGLGIAFSPDGGFLVTPGADKLPGLGPARKAARRTAARP